MYYVDKGRTIGLGGFYNDTGINLAHPPIQIYIIYFRKQE